MRNWLPLAIPAWLLACTDPSPIERDYGPVVVSVATEGGDQDLDGYRVIFDGEEPGQPLSHAVSVVKYLPVGDHFVEIVDVHDNCDVPGGIRRPVTAVYGVVTRVDFSVICYATGIAFTTVTQGIELDPNGYDLLITGQAGHTLPVNGSLTVGRLGPGSYDVRVDGLATNCTPEGELERTVEVTERQLTEVAFAITCVAATGVLEVTTRTTGTDLDLAGYLVTVGTTWQGNTTATATTAWFDGLPPGTYPVTLEQVASNCTVAGANPQNATISVTGQFTRDTTRVAFEVSCVRTPKIAYSREQSVLLAHADGSEVFVVAAAGIDPSWSPDGRHLVYSRVECYNDYWYYYYWYCNSVGLSRVSVDDLVVTDLTDGSDYSPAWSPDGTRIVFGRQGQLRILSLQSSVVTPLNPPVGSAEQPTWSPDGQRIAFTCFVDGQSDICAMNVDGTGFIRLTTSPDSDYRPAWSPGGDRIAFSSWRPSGSTVLTIPVAGGTVTSVTAGRLAAWAGSDTRLLYLDDQGLLNLINVDGSGHVTLPERSESAPAWRP